MRNLYTLLKTHLLKYFNVVCNYRKEIDNTKIMASIESLSDDYYKYIIQQKENPLVLIFIESKINKLIYTTSGKNISIDDKIKIITSIKNKFNQLNEGYDNTDFIKMLDELEKRLKK